jgi:hypothetical protein
MCESWTTFWPDFVTMTKRQLLGLGGTQTLSGIGSKLPYKTPKAPKLTFVKLAFSHILRLLGMTTWGVGSISFNMQAKVECNEDLAIVIWRNWHGYAHAFKSACMVRSLHLIRWCNIRRLIFLHNTMNQKRFMVNMF